jgi:cell division protein FtsW
MLETRGSHSWRRWWWSLDIATVILIACIMAIGALLITTASPVVAERLKLNSFYFVHRQLVFLSAASMIMFMVANLSEIVLRRAILVGFMLCIALMILVLFLGEEVKGARRWLSVLGVSIQPSEVLKPAFIYIVGTVLAEKFSRTRFPGFSLALMFYGLIAVLLVLQPDFGMIITYTVVLIGQLFLAGLSIWWLVCAGVAGAIGAVGAYHFLPHVQRRVNLFLHPEQSENFQVEKSLESYVSGGLFGRGPGEGVVKSHLPDSHTDFIFAVAGEELGSVFSTLVIMVFLVLIMRVIMLLLKEQDLLKIYVGAGIIMLFSLQTIFNVGVTLHLFPTKGMTLPFVSYGGSSALSYAICFGILLNFSRRDMKPKKSGFHHGSAAR